MEEAMNQINDFFITYGMSAIGAALIFVVGRWIAGVVSRFVERMMIKLHIEKTLAAFARNIVNITILAFVIISALGNLGVETATLVTIIGAASLAIGLALQGSLSNFAAGVLLMMLKPFKVGDHIEAGGTSGIVTEAHILNTIIHTDVNTKEIVPNSMITSSKISNFSDVAARRIDLIFSISYGDSVKRAKELLLTVLTSNADVLKDPAPAVGVFALTNTSVNLACRPWVKPDKYWDVYFDVMERGKEMLEENGITIPFPQREVHVYEEERTRLPQQ